MGYAFISYSSRNLENALAMRSALTNRGIKTWMAPGDIPAGSTYAGVITRAIKGAECLVLLLTDDSQNSKWVDKEVERALSYGRTVIPVALDDLVLNDNFEFYLGNQQIVPVKQISDDNGEFLRIVDQIVKLTGTEAVEEGRSANAGLRNTGNRSRVKSLTPYIPLIPEVGLIGRDDIVDRVRAMLDSDTSVALVSGLGGIGKTAVMAQICNCILSEGRKDTYVAWITCGESYMDDLLTLRQQLGIPKELKREEAYEAVIGKLQDLRGTLYIFFDDMARVPDKVELGTYNALRPNVRIMITSRHEIKGIPRVDLKELEKDPAVDMFYDYYGKDTERKYAADAWEIINSDSVRSHTLLVELLAKAANASFGSLADFRRRLENEGFLKVSRRKFDTGRFDNKTIEESVTQLYGMSHLSEEQQRIMRLFSIFTPEKVIYGAIEEWAEFDADAVDGLVKLGWLDRAENGFVIHQIIRDSLAEQVGGSLRIEDYGYLFKRVIGTDDYMPRDLEYTEVQERLVLTGDVARYLWTRVGGLLEIEHHPEEYKEFLTDSGALFNNMAGVYYAQGEYAKALEYYGKAVAIDEQVQGAEHPDTATTYNNMANVLRAQGEYEKALEYYGKALAIRERVLGAEHPDTATTYNNMAGLLRVQGEYGKSLEYYGKALTIVERVLGAEHPDTATTYNNMAVVYGAQGDYENALEYYGKALSIRERVLDPEHPDTAMTYSNMAGVLQAQGEYGKSLEYYGKALTIVERVLGPEHPDTATTYNNMALVYLAQGEYEKALEYYEKALVIFKMKLGEAHPYTQSAQLCVQKLEWFIKNGLIEPE